MKKNLALLLVGLFTIALFTACGGNQNDKPAAESKPKVKTTGTEVENTTSAVIDPVTGEPIPPPAPERTEEDIKNDEAALESARTNNDLEKCAEIQDEGSRNMCTQSILMSKALETKDAKYCDQLMTEASKKECYDIIK